MYIRIPDTIQTFASAYTSLKSFKLFISMYVTLLKSLSRGNPREVGSMVRLLILLPVLHTHHL